ncbi:MAG: TIGR02221 family CRISPR-associated protein [Armatimonadota bacterium]|nr:TIGR02221 family CRISPR-associated protein [Armatimonadota bacterium]MDR7528724.1 TIGR02221 family CRISPR-associated protein [Armatimonadota bacterium]
MNVLLTVLGTGRYETVRWRLKGQTREHETRYAPVATAALVGECEEARVLLTDEARAMHWETCRAELERQGLATRPVEIPVPRTEDEVWDLFARVLDSASGAEAVTLDVTHAFRHLPFVLFASMGYLAALRGMRVSGIYYGAYEARVDGRAPLLDLSPLLILGEWSHAARGFRETGNPRWLATLIRQERPRFFRRHGPFPELFDRLGAALEALGWALPAGLPLEAGREAARALAALDAVERSPHTPAPLRPLVGSLRETLASVALVGCPAEKTDIALDGRELDRELALARRYLDWGWADRALLLLREWVINRCLVVASPFGPWLSYGDARLHVERALNGVGERARQDRRLAQGATGESARGGGTRVEGGGLQACRAEVLDSSPPNPGATGDAEGQRWLASLWDGLAQLRNAFAHLGFRPEWVHDPRQRVAGWLEACAEFCKNDAVWRAGPPGAAGRVLITPLGMSPGVLFTALRRLAPDQALVITSPEAEALVDHACQAAGWPADRAVRLVLEDAHACFRDVRRVLDWARPVLLEARAVVVNVTGGTTAMQYLAERVAGEATRLGIPTRRCALVDRRPPEEQRQQPYVLGDCVFLEGDAASGPSER